jgi:endonuclease-8
VLTLDLAPVRRLGPDLLADGSDPAALVARLRRGGGSRPLGEVLQDQRLVAGIGNMWMAETLWAVRLSPWLAVAQAGDEKVLEALRWAQTAMRASVAGARPARAVYRRAGRPCGRCGTPIESRGQGDDNRTAYWCPVCQPLG